MTIRLPLSHSDCQRDQCGAGYVGCHDGYDDREPGDGVSDAVGDRDAARHRDRNAYSKRF